MIAAGMTQVDDQATTWPCGNARTISKVGAPSGDLAVTVPPSGSGGGQLRQVGQRARLGELSRKENRRRQRAIWDPVNVPVGQDSPFAAIGKRSSTDTTGAPKTDGTPVPLGRSMERR